MKRASISETKNQLSALLDQVRKGETILIVDRGVPVATLQPIAANTDESEESRLSRLERAGHLRRGTGSLPPAFFRRRLPRLPKDMSAVKLLLEERRSGR